jgi:hypothetical protein
VFFIRVRPILLRSLSAITVERARGLSSSLTTPELPTRTIPAQHGSGQQPQKSHKGSRDFVMEAVKEVDQLMRVLRGGIRERDRKGVRSPPASSGSNDGTPVYRLIIPSMQRPLISKIVFLTDCLHRRYTVTSTRKKQHTRGFRTEELFKVSPPAIPIFNAQKLSNSIGAKLSSETCTPPLHWFRSLGAESST